jgi:hypothetical protein
MEWYHYALLVGAGIIAGFINTLAGSGSLLTLPALMVAGLPPVIANGTNRIGILLQSIVAVGSFHKQKALDLKQGAWLSFPVLGGAIIGAIVATKASNQLMNAFIGGLLLFMFFIVLLKPSAWIQGQAGQIKARPGLLNIVVFTAIGFYGGFIQAGVGFFLLAGLVLSAGFNLVKANALKLFLVLIYAPFTLIVFILNNQVDYLAGIVLASGNMVGAYIGSKMAVKKGAGFVRYILLIVLVVASLKMLGVYDYLVKMITCFQKYR